MNNSNAHFSSLPAVNSKRSIFKCNTRHLTSGNAGKLYPIYVRDVLPGDTLSLDMATLSRMSTPIFPVMDDAYIDVHFFFVPLRLVWANSKYFFGEKKAAWDDDEKYETPRLHWDTVTQGELLDHLGFPYGTTSENLFAHALDVRSYHLIYNEWYRDQNLIDPVLINKGDTDSINAYNYGLLRSVAKYHDYFTSCLPSPQRGEAVPLPLGSMAPVLTSEQKHDYSTAPIYMGGFEGVTPNGQPGVVRPLNVSVGSVGNAGTVGFDADYSTAQGPDTFPVITNMWADLSKATAYTVNDLRQAFAIQRLFEKDALGGSRYRELVANHYGVSTGDARVQVPEYLGGRHIPIQVCQVVQMSATNEVSPQGNMAGFSKTVDGASIFTKSFTEHGILMGLASVRTRHSYQQGLSRRLSRRDRFDFYWPSLAFIGEQPVYNREIYAKSDDPDGVFGYQEAYADYRMFPDTVSGAFRSDHNTPLDSWHYADDYASTPRLGKTWIEESVGNVDRTLAVSSKVSDQFMFMFSFRENWARPIPLNGTPGLRSFF